MKAPGELPPEPRRSGEVLGGESEPPTMGPVEAVEGPAVDEPRGFDAETSEEVVGRRAERARTFLNQDGTYTTRFYNEPVNFLAGDGEWREIDTSLVQPQAAGARTMSGSDAAWEPVSAAEEISFAEYADAAPVVELGLGEGQSVGYAVDGAARARGAVDGSVITYPEVRPSADLELIAGSDSVKETLILKDADAPARWRFPLELEGLTARLDTHGGVVFVDSEGERRAWMPPGWMEDSKLAENANEGAISSGVSYQLSEESGRQILTVSLDEEWLSAPERIYPVHVDPSVKSVASTSGTYVESPYNQNFSSDTALKVGTYDGGGHKAAGFLRFSGLETTLKNAWVLGADLALYNTWSQSCTARPVTVHPVTSNWAETTTTNYPGPATGASLASKSFAHGWQPSGASSWTCGPAWESIRLGSAGRTLVDDWTHGRKKNYGLAVKASTSDSKGWKHFGSDDYPGGKPSLDVTWTKYGAAYKVGGFVAPVTASAEGSMKVTVTNQGQDTWPAGGNFKLRYNLYNESGTEITDSSKIRWTAMPSAVSPGESVTLEAKIAPLAPATYKLIWTMDDVGVSRFTSAGVPGAGIEFSAVNVPPQLTHESPSGGAVLDSLRPTLWAQGKDSDGFPGGALQYTFEVCEVSGKDTRKNCRSGTRTTAKQWAVPSGWLSWGKTYAWYAYVYDGAATSARPGPAFFTTQVPQPAVTGRLGADDGQEFGSRAANYSTMATDAAIPTVGPELAVNRTYNSLDPRRDNAFGIGWTTNWDVRLKEEPQTGSVLITLGDGSQVRFGVNPDGSYSGPSGGSLTLAREADGWVLRDRSGTTYRFSSAGLLGSIVDGAGRVQSLQYEQEDGGPLESVTDVLSGRSLGFTWSDGRVASVTTNPATLGGPGLTWTYTYDGERLTKVCPPGSMTECALYTYQDGSLYRSMVMDENPLSYWRLGEDEGPAGASQTPSASGGNEALFRDVLLARPGALTGTTDRAMGFDGTDSVVELPEDTLRTSTFLSVELWFKTSGSGVLLGFQDGRLDEGKPDDWNPVLVVDGAGKLRGEFLAGPTATPITTSVSVADDTWHHVVLTGAGTTQTLYLDGAVVGTLVGPIDHRERSYAYLGSGWSSPGWDGAAAGVRPFTGQLDDVAVYHHPLDRATVAEHYAARTATGRITEVVSPSGRVHAEVAYDPATGRVVETTDENGGTWQISAPAYSSASSSYARAVTDSNPLGYWRLGERTGASAASAVGEGMDGSYLDGVRLGGAGVFADGDDTSVTFDGDASQGAVEVPVEALGTTTTPSAEMWFRTTKPGVLLSMQDKELGETPSQWRPILLVDSDGKLRGRFTGGSGVVTSKSAVTDDRWHQVVLTTSQGQQLLYVDGQLQGTAVAATDTVRWPRVYIGGGYSSPLWDGQPGGYRNFRGQIDEVALYDTSLVLPPAVGDTNTYREKEISGHYRARSGLVSGDGDVYRGSVISDAPAAYWRLDETEGTRLASDMAASDSDATFLDAAETTSAPTQLGATGAFGPGSGSSVQLGGRGAIEFPAKVLGGTPDLAVEMWFRTSSAGVLMGAQNSPLGTTATSWRPVLNIDQAGRLRGEFWLSGVSGATPITSSQAVTDGDWHHVVLSAAGTTQSLYLDGVLIGTLSGTRVDQRTTHAYIGAGYASQGWMGVPEGTYYFTGQIDEPAVYQHALTEEQVSNHYEAQARPANTALGATVTVTDPAGRSSSTTYDMLRGQRPVAQSDAEGGATTFAYDAGGFLHTVTDPNGHSTVTGHDERGNAVSSTTCRDSDSCWTSFTDYYLNAGDDLDPRNDRPTAVRDARSTSAKDDRYKTELAYSALGLPLSTKLADGRQSTVAYTDGTEAALGGGTVPAGLTKTEMTPAGAVTSYGYFANGDLAQSVSPSGLTTKFTYDGLGRKLTETQISDAHPAGITSAYVYDSLSRVISETGVEVRNEITDVTHTAKITFTYDADGKTLTESAEDTTGGDTKRTTTYHYDEHGLNDRVTDAEGATTRFGHDAMGRLASETDALDTRLEYTYTPRGQLAETVLKDWTGDPSGAVRDLVLESHAYDPAGRPASSTDAMGATTAFTYYDDGLPATTTARQVTQADGTERDIVLESNGYDGAGHATSLVTGGGATTVTAQVDATGRVTSTSLDPTGLNRRTAYGYDHDDRLTEQTETVDATGKTLRTTVEYDAAGNPTKETLTDGVTTHISTSTFDQRGLETSSVDPRGNAPGADPAAHTTTYRYDVLGRLIEEVGSPVDVAENGGTPVTARPTMLTGYNTFGEETESRDERGAVTRTALDRSGRSTSLTLPDYTPPGGSGISAVEHTTYDALGQVIAESDALGRTTRYAYDQLGRLVEQTDPAAQSPASQPHEESPLLSGGSVSLDGGGITRYAWTPTGLQLSVTDPTGARAEATYDELGRQLTATVAERYPSPQNLTSRYTWDDAGNQTASSTPAGRITRGTFNAAGEPVTVTDAAQGVTRFGYDGLGRTTETTDPTGRRTTMAYDALDNVTSIADHGTGSTVLRTTEAEFDVNGNLLAAVSATGARTTYTYDALGRMTGQAEPVADGRSITMAFGYDAAGNRTRTTDGRGNTTTYTYTPWGLPESTVEPVTAAHPALADRTFTTVYDAAGQDVAELLPGGVRRERIYDALGRLTGETGTGAEAATTTRTFAYDLADRMISQGTDSALAQDTFTYNDRGLLLTAQGPSGTSSYTYDADGGMTARTNGGWTTEYGYDSAGRIDWLWDEITGNDIWYDFDAAGRPTIEQYAVLPTGSTDWTVSARRSYGYDSLGRLTSDRITDPTGVTQTASTSYGYDLDDRLTSKSTQGVAGASDNTYAYDRAGRLTAWTNGPATTSYEWDDAGNRSGAGNAVSTYDARNRLLTDGTSAYGYTPRGTLTSVTAPGQDTRSLSFDAFERKITDGASTFAYDSLDRVLRSGQTSLSYDGGSDNLAADGTGRYSRTPDGSLLAIAKGTTRQWAVTDRHTDLVAGLSPDGTTVTGSTSYDPFGEQTASAGTTSALGYQSGWTDPASGDVNMAARWYQPGTGGFSSRDTLRPDPGPSAQANLYLYANGDPLNGIDPSGHKSIALGGVPRGGVGMSYSYTGKPYTTARGASGKAKPKSGSKAKKSSAAKRNTTGSSRTNSSLSRNQARRVQQDLRRLEASRSAGTRPTGRANGTGRSSGGGRCTYNCGTGVRPATTPTRPSASTPRSSTPTKPVRPPTPQNPNRGPHPQPAPARPAPKPQINIARTQQHTLDTAVRHDQAALVEMVAVDQVAFEPVESGMSNSGSGGDRRDKREDCRRNGEGWREYGDLDVANGNRSTGVEACLNTAFIKENPGSNTNTKEVAPPGYGWANRAAAFHGNKPPYFWRNACHLLGKQLGGDGLDLRNLSTCARAANANPVAPGDPGLPQHMYTFESQVQEAVAQGQTVSYHVVPKYADTRTVPVSYEITARGITAGGRLGLVLDEVVPNMMYSTKSKLHFNLGLVSRNGQPVPTGGMQ
ncbi:LamG-like jellyroll fold domain-containing protein [Streptomyces sp. NPDC088341]|uniref:LamG-like jellyroll fold domain-containing protein n=1 Tax=Streptomyces sp. NPDC088341 TaxID=3154870 RepID=UPI00342CC201